MKKIKILFWISTSLIFVFEGVLPALTSHTELSISAITHLGYPVYFVTLLTVFKVLGALALIIPKVPDKPKEWAYAGFGIDFVSALVSILVVDGFGTGVILPVVFIAILVVSYSSYHKIRISEAVMHQRMMNEKTV